MKREVIFSFLILSVVILSTLAYAANSAASSASSGISQMFETVGSLVKSIYDSGVQPLAKFLLGEEAATDTENTTGATKFFTLILILILLVSVLWEITDRIPMLNSNSWVQFIISFFVAVITTRFLAAGANSAWFETVILPHQVLGIALICALPFVIWVVFAQDIGEGRPWLRKILYVLGGVIFIVLYFVRYEEIGSTESGFNPSNIYLYTALASFLLLLLDGTITRAWHKGHEEAALAAGHSRLARMLERDLAQLDEDWAQGRIVNRAGQPDRARYQRERDSIMQRILHLRAG